jgi:soluble cytochrome b562
MTKGRISRANADRIVEAMTESSSKIVAARQSSADHRAETAQNSRDIKVLRHDVDQIKGALNMRADTVYRNNG